MGFIISESGFEMTPGSREVDTPGIWRQDGTMSTVGDAFSSAFATAMDAAPSPKERQEMRDNRLQRRADRIGNRIQKNYSSALTGNQNLKKNKLIDKQKKILGKKSK